MPAARILLRGGEVVDGSGAGPRRADVLVHGGLIADVGVVSEVDGADVVDVTGRMVLPGFVDCHVHVDGLALRPEVQHATLRQGVTTWILGQDGVSFAPSSAGTLRYVEQYFGAINGPAPADLRACTVAELLACYDRSTAVNVGYLIPAGTVRAEVMGMANREPTDAERSRMGRLVEDGMADGALGLSTGLDYVPGRFADASEIASLCQRMAAGGIYVTHMRGYGEHAPVGVAEVRKIAEAAGAAVHISHYHGPGNLLAKLVDEAVSGGVDVTFDTYPYTRGNTILAMLLLPPDLQDGGVEETLNRLAEPEVQRRLRADWFPKVAEKYPLVTLSHVGSSEWRWAEGMSVSAAAQRAGMAAEEFVCKVLVDASLDVAAVMRQPYSSEDGVRTLMRHERQTVGSDGIVLGGRPHPRFWGTFARLLGRHTRELGDWTWGGAAVHLSSRPMERFGLRGRGRVEPGHVADLCVVDGQRVADRATYEDPRRVADGIDDVMVDGVWALRHGELTGATPGRALRPTQH